MTKDDILHALRLTAMGRTGHPLQEQLAEKLAELLAGRDIRPFVAASEMRIAQQTVQMGVQPQFAPAGSPDPIQAVKRGPGRPKKAD